MSVTFNFNRLRGLIREYGNQADFALAIGISATTLSERLNNKSAFDSIEIDKAMKIFGLSDDQINEIFFVR